MTPKIVASTTGVRKPVAQRKPYWDLHQHKNRGIDHKDPPGMLADPLPQTASPAHRLDPTSRSLRTLMVACLFRRTVVGDPSDAGEIQGAVSVTALSACRGRRAGRRAARRPAQPPVPSQRPSDETATMASRSAAAAYSLVHSSTNALLQPCQSLYESRVLGRRAEVGNGPHEAATVITEITEGIIAPKAQQASYGPSLVVVVDVQGNVSTRQRITDGAPALLV